MSEKKWRVCVIGAGPSGMSALYQFGLRTSPPEVVCYEKQSTWGGLWNLSWTTGTDEFGEPCHNGMYKHLWVNTPKETFEYPDYTYDQHFKKAIPSFVPRDIQREYIEGRWKSSKTDLKEKIKFNHVVRYVTYDKTKGKFTVAVEDLQTEKTSDEIFSHVIVSTGVFNVPNMPYFPGIESFPGRILHAHDLRNAEEFKGQRVLAVGARYSAEDVVLQSVKFGAKSAVSSWRSKPMNFIWPKGIEERPLVEKIEGSMVSFKDGSQSEFDAIVFASGYKYHFPFMEDSLRLVSLNTFYADKLYKGIVMTKGGNNKCFYIGAVNQYYSFPMFDVQAAWVCRYIDGTLPEKPPSAESMRKDIDKWLQRLSTLKTSDDDIDFQTDYVADLCQVTGYDKRVLKNREIYKTWEAQKKEDMATFRDRCFASKFTGTVATKPKRPWMENFDDSNEGILA